MRETQAACLEADEILSYLEGGPSAARRSEIERHLAECRLCGAAVEGVAGLEWREGYLRSADAVRRRIQGRTAAARKASAAARRVSPRFRPIPAFLTLAASVVVGVSAVSLLRPAPGKALFDRYFEPYPSIHPVVRGSGTPGHSDALALYESRDYRGALARLEAEPRDATVLFYTGLSRLAMGEDKEAAVALEQVLGLGDSELQAPAAWYLALSHVRGGDLGAARSELQAIAAAGGFYQERARSLLSELNRL